MASTVLQEVLPILENHNKNEKDDFLTFDEPTHILTQFVMTFNLPV